MLPYLWNQNSNKEVVLMALKECSFFVSSVFGSCWYYLTWGYIVLISSCHFGASCPMLFVSHIGQLSFNLEPT